MREGPADVPHQISGAHLLEAAAVFDAATALNTALDMVAPQPTLVQRLVRPVLLPRALLLQIEINSNKLSTLLCLSSPTILPRRSVVTYAYRGDALLRSSTMAQRQAPAPARHEPEALQVKSDTTAGRFMPGKAVQRRQSMAGGATFTKR
jgi:hypothetical protein